VEERLELTRKCRVGPNLVWPATVGTSNDWEVFMSPNGNEYTYAKQFEGNLRGSSEPVPARLNTSVRMMSPEMVQELQKLDHRTSGAPLYVFVRRDDLPLHPSLQATGLHYFEW
jgi:hypothetical protein